jgi:hypothetical protein
MLDKKVFKEGMKELELAFNLNLTSPQLDVWYKYCETFKNNEFKKKVTNCIKFCKHKPYIADLLNLEGKNEFSLSNAAAYKIV